MPNKFLLSLFVLLSIFTTHLCANKPKDNFKKFTDNLKIANGDFGKKIKHDSKMSNINIFKDIFLSVDYDLVINSKEIFLSKKYDDLNIRQINTLGSLDALHNLKTSKSNISIVRGDILTIKKTGMLGLSIFDNYGIVCSPSSSRLYLISDKNITTINDLKNMKIATGLASNIAQVYLSNIAKNSGMSLSISYFSMDFDNAISKFERGELDAIFMFAPISATKNIIKKKLPIVSIPNDFFTNLDLKTGLENNSYYIKDRRIRTLEVQNFIIAPKDTLDTKINFKIEAMVSAFECYRTIQNIDKSYGTIHTEVKKSISKIQDRIDKEASTGFKFVSKTVNKDSVEYIYNIVNSSSIDMNISLKELRSSSFDNIPIRPRHLINVIPSGMIIVPKKGKQKITFIYKNPFIYRIKNKTINIVYENLSVKGDDDMIIKLNVGDKK